MNKLKNDIFGISYCLKYRFKQLYEEFIKGIYIPSEEEWVYIKEKAESNQIDKLRSGEDKRVDFNKPLILFFIDGKEHEIKSLPYEIDLSSLNLKIKKIDENLKVTLEITSQEGKPPKEKAISNGEQINLLGEKISYFIFNPEMFKVNAIIVITPPFIIGKLRNGRDDSPININGLNFIVDKEEKEEKNFKYSVFNNDSRMYVSSGKPVTTESIRENCQKLLEFFEISKRNNYLVLQLKKEVRLTDIFKDKETVKKIVREHKNEWILCGVNKVCVVNYKFGGEESESEFAFLLEFSKEFKEFLKIISKIFD